jgi:hypothetical protein
MESFRWNYFYELRWRTLCYAISSNVSLSFIFYETFTVVGARIMLSGTQ